MKMEEKQDTKHEKEKQDKNNEKRGKQDKKR